MRTSAEKQLELIKLKTILLATIDYLIDNSEITDVSGEEDSINHLYEHFRVQIEKYFEQRRLDRLHNRLSMLFDMLIGRRDLIFEKYIKEKTGYEIDLLEGLRNRVNFILNKNEICTEMEARDISLLLNYPDKTSLIKDDFGRMNALLIEYAEKSAPAILEKQKGYNLIIKVEEKDGMEITSITMDSGPKRK